MTTATITATNHATGEASAPLSFTYTVTTPPPPPPSGVLYGATCGQGPGNAHATPDLAGLQAFHTKTGTFPATCKLFGYTGYPTCPATWPALAATLAGGNQGHPMLILLAIGGTPPTAATLGSLLGSLPAGQRAGFIWESEAENSGSGVTGPAFVAAVHTLSANLNTALAHMGGGTFWTRANFPVISSAYMAYYQATPGSTAYIPAPGDVDAYGADLYHKGPQTDMGAATDPRYQGYVKAVKAKVGAAKVAYAFPEYGIDVANITDAQRATILSGDIAYMTGPSAPGTFWGLNYWFEVGNSGQQYPFTAPSATAAAWSALCQ